LRNGINEVEEEIHGKAPKDSRYAAKISMWLPNRKRKQEITKEPGHSRTADRYVLHSYGLEYDADDKSIVNVSNKASAF
jgi:hypothetical protein